MINTERRVPWKQIVFRVAASAGVVAFGAFGSGKAESVFAGDPPTATAAPTPTPPKPTPTPGATTDIQIANALATSTALAGIETLAEAEAKKRQELADILATQTAKTDRINALNGTPTKEPPATATGTATLPPTATATFTNEQIRGMKGAGIWPTNTPSPSPEPVPTEAPGEKDSLNVSGGSFLDNLPTINQILVGLGAVVVLSAIGASLHRWRNRAWFWQ